MNKLDEIFCDVDDFCKAFIPLWEQQCLNDGTRKRKRPCRMSSSEIMTIIIAFHTSNHRDFKNFYLGSSQHQLWLSQSPEALSTTTKMQVMGT